MRGSGNNWLNCLTGAGSQFHIDELQPHQRRVAGNKRTLALILILCKLPKGPWLAPLHPVPVPGSILDASQVTKDSSQEKARHETKTLQLGQQNMQIPHWKLPAHPIPAEAADASAVAIWPD